MMTFKSEIKEELIGNKETKHIMYIEITGLEKERKKVVSNTRNAKMRSSNSRARGHFLYQI